jgi:hypothetical protein
VIARSRNTRRSEPSHWYVFGTALLESVTVSQRSCNSLVLHLRLVCFAGGGPAAAAPTSANCSERKRVSDRTVKYLINGTLCPEKSRADFLARISDNRYLTKRGNSCEKG